MFKFIFCILEENVNNLFYHFFKRISFKHESQCNKQCSVVDTIDQNSVSDNDHSLIPSVPFAQEDVIDQSSSQPIIADTNVSDNQFGSQSSQDIPSPTLFTSKGKEAVQCQYCNKLCEKLTGIYAHLSQCSAQISLISSV
jgi:hypothetical protein